MTAHYSKSTRVRPVGRSSSKKTQPVHRKAARKTSKSRARPKIEGSRYSKLGRIDGRHPLQDEVPSAVVTYPARRRRDSDIAFFNFDLAREIGLLPARHPDEIPPALRRALLDSFSLVIVNEWDQEHGNLPSARDRREHSYMATRYLQLQHPDKRGYNSGDGRSIWNGFVRGHNRTWDVSSCGTGVTRLCPATSALGRFFKTGNAITDYGCGTAHIEEGIGAALMSEVFAANDVRTERVLAVLSLPSGQAINVRAAPNLLRPSHFFGLLRRRDDEGLRRCVLYHAEREIRDGRWPALSSEPARIRHLAEQVAVDFARASATFESEYIFCWLDWDGDNVLTDGSIIDYGSVRQFGLYHHSYRFEDTDRMSTSIPEQKRKARQIVQRFIQIRELLLQGESPSLADLTDDPVLELFDREFEAHKRRLFVRKLGFDDRDVDSICVANPSSLDRLLRLHNRLERRRSSRGPKRVADGLSWNAVYCMRDVLRKMPRRLLELSPDADLRLSPREFYRIAMSDYASRKDRRLNPYRRQMASAYQKAFLDLCGWVASNDRQRSPRDVIEAIAPTAAIRNPRARMTGDGLTHATRRLTRNRRRLAPEETYRLVQAFVDTQLLDDVPERRTAGVDAMAFERPLIRRIHRDMLQIADDFRESL